MIDLDRFKDRTPGDYIVKHTKDDSGDYTNHNYTIFAVYPWGERSLTSCIENPYDAAMFAAGPEMIKEILELRKENKDLKFKIRDVINILYDGDE